METDSWTFKFSGRISSDILFARESDAFGTRTPDNDAIMAAIRAAGYTSMAQARQKYAMHVPNLYAKIKPDLLLQAAYVDLSNTEKPRKERTYLYAMGDILSLGVIVTLKKTDYVIVSDYHTSIQYVVHIERTAPLVDAELVIGATVDDGDSILDLAVKIRDEQADMLPTRPFGVRSRFLAGGCNAILQFGVDEGIYPSRSHTTATDALMKRMVSSDSTSTGSAASTLGSGVVVQHSPAPDIYKCPRCTFTDTEGDTFFAHMGTHFPLTTTDTAATSSTAATSTATTTTDTSTARADRLMGRTFAAAAVRSMAATAKQYLQTVHKCTAKSVNCYQLFTTEDDLKSHLVAVHGYVVCDLCPKAYKNSESLRKHKDALHKNYKLLPPPTTLDPSDTQWKKCDFCTEIVRNSKKAERDHLLSSHRDLGKFPCDFCGIMFFKSNTRFVHQANCDFRRTFDSNRTNYWAKIARLEPGVGHDAGKVQELKNVGKMKPDERGRKGPLSVGSSVRRMCVDDIMDGKETDKSRRRKRSDDEEVEDEAEEKERRRRRRKRSDDEEVEDEAEEKERRRRRRERTDAEEVEDEEAEKKRDAPRRPKKNDN